MITHTIIGDVFSGDEPKTTKRTWKDVLPNGVSAGVETSLSVSEIEKERREVNGPGFNEKEGVEIKPLAESTPDTKAQEREARRQEKERAVEDSKEKKKERLEKSFGKALPNEPQELTEAELYHKEVISKTSDFTLQDIAYLRENAPKRYAELVKGGRFKGAGEGQKDVVLRDENNVQQKVRVVEEEAEILQAEYDRKRVENAEKEEQGKPDIVAEAKKEIEEKL